MLAIGHSIGATGIACGVQGNAGRRAPGAHRRSTMSAHVLELGYPLLVEVLAGLRPGARTGRRPAVRGDANGAEREDVFLVGHTPLKECTARLPMGIDTVAFGGPGRTHEREAAK